MPVYGRHGVLAGQSLDLRVVFTDDIDNLVDPDVLPQVYIYDESIDIETIEAEVAAATFTSAFAGPLSPIQIATGFYLLNYTVPTASNEGTWHDVWISTVGSIASNKILEFEVEVGAVLTAQTLLNNELIIIELDSSISNLAGTLTLSIDTEVAFSTVYSPLYASPDLIRLEVGPFVDYIPDDTLALFIHWSSKEADFISNPVVCNSKSFEFARTKFVVFDAALRSLTLPKSGSRDISDNRKTLGDLTIAKSGTSSTVDVTSSGIDIETLKYLRDKRDEWWRVVNAGACIVPGQSFDPDFAIKGRFNSERRITGRLWENPDQVRYLQPGANSKVVRAGKLRGRFTYSNIPGRWRERLNSEDD